MRIVYWALGIVVSLLVIGLIAVSISQFQFNRNVKAEVKELFGDYMEENREVITEEDIAVLPEPVQRWLKYSKVVGKENIYAVRLKQTGMMQTEKDKPWMPSVAEQYFTTDKPGFIWKTKVEMNPLIFLSGRDKYYQGRGQMLIKLMSLIPVVDYKSEEMDQGTLLRYLGETVWFPTGVLNDYIEWKEVDSNSARATMSYGGITASGVFHFNDKGQPTKFTCKRYYAGPDGNYSLEDYVVAVDEYREMDGIMIPVKGRAMWELESGTFTYYKLEITEVEYNNPSLY